MRAAQHPTVRESVEVSFQTPRALRENKLPGS